MLKYIEGTNGCHCCFWTCRKTSPVLEEEEGRYRHEWYPPSLRNSTGRLPKSECSWRLIKLWASYHCWANLSLLPVFEKLKRGRLKCTGSAEAPITLEMTLKYALWSLQTSLVTLQGNTTTAALQAKIYKKWAAYQDVFHISCLQEQTYFLFSHYH